MLVEESTPGGGIKNENMPGQQWAEGLHKPIIVKFEKRKLHSSFMDNIWAADLADMQLIGKCNNGFLFFVMCYWYL